MDNIVSWLSAVAALCAVTLSGCDRMSGTVSPEKSLVRVAAAANLKFALDEIVQAFEARHPDTKVAVTYGSSGNFFAQLSNEAPFDLFLSADVEYPRKLIENGAAKKGSDFVYAVGRLALWVPKSSRLDIDKLGLAAVADPAVKKVAIANPKHAPYGRAAESALQKSQLYDRVKDRLVLGENIEQTAQFIETGAADIGIISLSLARSAALREKGRFIEIPETEHPMIEQAGVVLSWAKDQAAVDRLRDFLLAEPGRDVLKKYGYGWPGTN